MGRRFIVKITTADAAAIELARGAGASVAVAAGRAAANLVKGNKITSTPVVVEVFRSDVPPRFAGRTGEVQS
jgi:hypothetical protein